MRGARIIKSCNLTKLINYCLYSSNVRSLSLYFEYHECCYSFVVVAVVVQYVFSHYYVNKKYYNKKEKTIYWGLALRALLYPITTQEQGTKIIISDFSYGVFPMCVRTSVIGVLTFRPTFPQSRRRSRVLKALIQKSRDAVVMSVALRRTSVIGVLAFRPAFNVEICEIYAICLMALRLQELGKTPEKIVF